MFLRLIRRLFSDRPRTAVLMITHQNKSRVLEHFERLRRESHLPTFLAQHVANGELPMPFANIHVTDEKIRETFPKRATQKDINGRKINQGYVDLVFVTAAADRQIAGFEHVWILEADVDYAGRWSEFFALYETNNCDLLGCRVRRRSDEPEWSHWRWFKAPANAEPFASFVPAARYSRRLIRAYLTETQKKQWSGHYEAIFPTVALAGGMKIGDMFGVGEFAAAHSRAPVSVDSFGYRPFRSACYFHEDPQAFPQADMLYHPVKAFD
jgi:hypothetical protein